MNPRLVEVRSQRRTTVLTGLAGRGGASFWQVVTKTCRLSWLTNSALVYEPKCGGRGGVAGSQPMSAAVHRNQTKLLSPYLTYVLVQLLAPSTQADFPTPYEDQMQLS